MRRINVTILYSIMIYLIISTCIPSGFNYIEIMLFTFCRFMSIAQCGNGASAIVAAVYEATRINCLSIKQKR